MDQPRVGSAARATIAAVRDFAERASALLSAPQVLRDGARHQIEMLNGDQVVARLREMPIDALKDVAGRGVRFRALEQSGYRTVADVLNSPDHRLQQVPGVGQATVQEVRRAVRTVAVRVHQDVRYRFDPDRRDTAQTQRRAGSSRRSCGSERLLFDELARKSDAKDADRRAADTSDHRPEALDDESVPLERRVLLAERYRLGLER